MSELFEYLNQIVWEVESGRLSASEVRRRLVRDWGGTRVSGYMPREIPEERLKERAEIRRLVAEGVPPRTARLKVRGK